MQGLLAHFGNPAAGIERLAWLRRSIAAFGLALVAATWKLWLPQHDFPQVPLVRAALGVPEVLQWLGAAGLVAGLCGMLVARGARLVRAASWCFAASGLALVLLDQHRLQPWLYQFVLMIVVLALAEAPTAVALLRLLIVSFYLHSALTKFDSSFLHELGPQFLEALAGAFGRSLDAFDATQLAAASAILPAGELAVAVGLCFAQSRRWAIVGAVLLHLLLLVILGPWGLHHKPGVLIWNVYFIVQDVLLFGGARPRATVPQVVAPAAASQLAPGARVAATIVALAAILPLLSPTAWFDIWPSWGLYASCAERVTLLVHRLDLERLPPQLRSLCEATDDPLDPWLRLRLDRWSLNALAAPLYPQNRFQLGVAEAVVVRYQLGNRARVVRAGLANRWTGQRRLDVLVGLPRISAAEDDYFFNARPRLATFDPPESD